MEIGNKILQLRKRSGMSQEQLAEKMGVARQTISKWELGETYPDISQAKKLSSIFKVSLDELVDNDTKEIVEEKLSNIEKLAGMIIFIIKFGFGIFIGMIVLSVISIILFLPNSKKIETNVTDELMCTIEEKVYRYEITYSEEDNHIYDYAGDNIDSIVEGRTFDTASELEDIIIKAIKSQGGSCETVESE